MNRSNYTVVIRPSHGGQTRSAAVDGFGHAKQIAQNYADEGYSVEIIEHIGERRTIAVFATKPSA